MLKNLLTPVYQWGKIAALWCQKETWWGEHIEGILKFTLPLRHFLLKFPVRILLSSGASCSKPNTHHYTPDSAAENRNLLRSPKWRCFFSLQRWILCVVKKPMPSIESLVTQGDKFIIACCGSQLLSGPGSCMNKLPAAGLSLPALWRSRFRVLLEANSEKSAAAERSRQWQITEEHLHRSFRWKNMFFFISQEGLGSGPQWILCWITALKEQSDNVARKEYSGEKEEKTGWICKLTAAFGAKEGFFSGVCCQWQGGPCSQRENWLGQSVLVWQALTQSVMLAVTRMFCWQKRYRRGQWNIINYF